MWGWRRKEDEGGREGGRETEGEVRSDKNVISHGEGGKQRRRERGGKREEEGEERGRERGRGGWREKEKGGELLGMFAKTMKVARNLSLLQQLYHLSKQDRPYILSALYATTCTLCALWKLSRESISVQVTYPTVCAIQTP